MISSVEGKLEVSLAGLMLLGVATLVTTGVVFLLGAYVGKGLAERRFAEEQRVVRLPLTVAPPAKTGEGQGEGTIWDRLSRGEGEKPEGAAPAPAATEGPIHVPAPQAPTPASTPTAVPTVVPTATAVPAAARPAAPRPAVPPAPPPVAGGMRYQVQVNAMAEKARAEQLVRDLKTAGYNAYISPGAVSGRTLYRVRVGKFPNEESARQAVSRLREQGYPNAFLAAE